MVSKAINQEIWAHDQSLTPQEFGNLSLTLTISEPDLELQNNSSVFGLVQHTSYQSRQKVLTESSQSLANLIMKTKSTTRTASSLSQNILWGGPTLSRRKIWRACADWKTRRYSQPAPPNKSYLAPPNALKNEYATFPGRQVSVCLKVSLPKWKKTYWHTQDSQTDRKTKQFPNTL